MRVLAHKAQKRHDIDMTQGNVFSHILQFSLPLLLGNIFQQLYNTVDTWVVGNYVSNAAFSAVGTVGPIINILIGMFMGLASGAGVVISQYYGARQLDKVRNAVHTAVMLTFLLTIFFTALGIAITPAMLRMMKTPSDVMPEATEYLTIYFAGLAGLLFYNMGAGILRAVGDSKRPFYYLVVAAVLNTVLDLLFVIVFEMGVAGVAYATIIAQAVSAILTMLTLLRSDSCIRVIPRDIRLHRDMLKQTVRIGIPAALQMAVTAFSNVFVQAYINQFGAECMGGWTAYTKIDQLIFLPMQSIALAATTFVGQNLGVGQVDRAKKGVRTSFLMAFVITIIISIGTITFAAPLVRFFNDDPDVLSYGVMFLHWLTPFYFLCCVNQVYSAALRGAGDSRAPMIIMLASFVVFRQIYLFIVSNFISNTVLPLAMGYPAGWIVCSVSVYLYYRHVKLDKASVTGTKA